MSKATKKVRDKWRAKEWYSVFTPSYFGEMSVALIPVEDPKKLIGRVVETTLYEITNDFAHQSTKLYFLVVANKGDRCDTILKSHEYSTDYLRSLVRRGSTRMDGIFTASTIDKYLTRVYIVAFSHGRIKGSQEHAVRQVMGKMGSDVYNEAKKVCPLRHVGVRKSKLLSMPLAAMEKAPETTVPAEEEVAAPVLETPSE